MTRKQGDQIISISDAAKTIGMSRRTLQFYLSSIPELAPTGGGRRGVRFLFTADLIQELMLVSDLWSFGITYKNIRKFLKQSKETPNSFVEINAPNGRVSIRLLKAEGGGNYHG